MNDEELWELHAPVIYTLGLVADAIERGADMLPDNDTIKAAGEWYHAQEVENFDEETAVMITDLVTRAVLEMRVILGYITSNIVIEAEDILRDTQT